jgi:NADH dehydrogenase FAD-containing subunit
MTAHIVVLGAGYAGHIAASRLAARTDAAVTLVNANDHFVERVRLHQLAAGQTLPRRPLAATVAGTGIDLIVDRATEIDADAGLVRLAGRAQPLTYDTLVYALGSSQDVDAVPGVAGHAYNVGDYQAAQRLSARLAHARTVAVVGAGLTGIETAAEIAETRPEMSVTLVTSGDAAAGLSERGREHVLRAFERLGVGIRDNVRVAAVRVGGLRFADGDGLDADTVVWTTGFAVPALAAEAGLAVDGDGRVLVDDTMRSVSHPDVYAVGDAAAGYLPGGQPLRMACATAAPMAQHMAGALSARLTGAALPTWKFSYRIQCVSLGRRDGLVELVTPDDRPTGRVLTGRLGAMVKETIARGAYLLVRYQSLPVGG